MFLLQGEAAPCRLPFCSIPKWAPSLHTSSAAKDSSRWVDWLWPSCRSFLGPGLSPSYTKLVVVPPVLSSVEALVVLPGSANSFRLTAHRTRPNPRGVPVECRRFPAQPPPSSLASRAPMAPQAIGWPLPG